jgi:hypothetical protein
MAGRIVRPVGPGAPPVEAAPCTLLTPTFKECAPLCCPPPQCGTCAPRTRINEAIKISPEYAETRLKVGTWGCDGMTIEAFSACIELHIQRRGWCDIVLTLKPYRATLDGEAVFHWDDAMWALGEGYYEADVVVNGRACLTIGLHVPHCRHRLWTAVHAERTHCGPGELHADAACCVPALIDPVPAMPVEPGDCNAAECG